MISKKMETAINKQINLEIQSALLYLQMAAHFAHENLNGFAHWMRIQHSEELVHANKLFDASGNLANEDTKAFFTKIMQAFGAWIETNAGK